VGIIGVAFKEGTDDVRESPMVHVVEQLCGKGHPVRIYDEHLAVAQLVGSNLNFALGSIPHLTELLSDDLNQVVGGSDLVVVGHRLTEEKWRQVTWAGQRVIDTVRVPALESLPNYEGLYW
jgi:GDP-mannose 6-dehydrogenase